MSTFPANTGHSPNAVSMLGQRRSRWAVIETELGECLVFDELWCLDIYEANTGRRSRDGIMLGLHLRCWASIETTSRARRVHR